MIGLGFIPLYMAIHYIRNRAKYSWEYIAISVVYIIGIPVVYYDYFIYSNRDGLKLILADNIIAFIASKLYLSFALFLLYKGLRYGYSHFFRKEEE